jgi:hypothetical protein
MVRRDGKMTLPVIPPVASVPPPRDQVLEAILAELRAIRAAIEKPRQTAERENAEFLSSFNK